VCIYVQSSLAGSMPYLVHPNPKPTSPSVGLLGSSGPSIFETRLPAFNDPEPTATPVRNLIYAADTPVFTDIVVGMDAGTPVYADQVLSITNETGPGPVGFAKSPFTQPYVGEFVKRGYWGDGNGQMFAYSTCKWLRKCDTTETLGSACSAVLSSVTYSGYCYKSDTNSLECGRATALDDEYGESPTDLNVYDPYGTYRCPMGSPAKTLGSFVSKRMKVAGCMVSSDPNYDPLAEVHVPDYCKVQKAPWKAGCLLAGALNYDPAAKMSGPCSWPTLGCMDSTALNYNPLATANDPAAPCVATIIGCTVNAQGVLVTNYDSAATVNSACSVLIEGCMDPTAVNYNSQATVQTAGTTTCIPSVSGCMEPAVPLFYAGPGTSVANGQTYVAGVKSAGYNSAATVHIPSTCGVSGCTDPTAMNYNPLATISAECYQSASFGCLNPLAVNFNCSSSTATAACDSLSTRVAVHSFGLCNWAAGVNGGTGGVGNAGFLNSNPSPPFPPVPAGQTYTQVFQIQAEVMGKPDDFVNNAQTLLTAMTTQLGLAASEATKLTVSTKDASDAYVEYYVSDWFYGGSRRLQSASAGNVQQVTQTTYTSQVSDSTRADSLVSSASSNGNVMVSVLSSLAQQTGNSYTVVSQQVSAGKVLLGAFPPPSAPSSSSDDSATVIIIVVVVIVVVLLAAAGAYLYKMKKSKPVYPA